VQGETRVQRERGIKELEKAVVDRIVDKRHAVLLVGENEVEKIVSVDKLPPGAGEGTWLRVELEGDELAAVEVDAEETAQVRARLAAKMERLRQRGRKTGK